MSKQSNLSRKEVFQPHLPVRLPCYDLAPVTSFALGRSLRSRTSGTPGFHGLTGGVYIELIYMPIPELYNRMAERAKEILQERKMEKLQEDF